MFSLFKRKEYQETSLERVSKLEKRITRIEAELLDLATSQDIIRNKVLRKIQFKKPKEEEEETEEYPHPKGIIPFGKDNFGADL